MNRISIFQVLRSGRFSALVALVVLGLLFTASGVKAGCGVPETGKSASSIPFVSPPKGGESLSHQEGDEWNGPATIVGLWHVLYTATSVPISIPAPPFNFTPPFPFLESYKTWHVDSTEFENAFLNPAGGNICFGVWKDVKGGSVKLHHIGLMFMNPGNTPSNIFTVDETDTVAADGKTYTGHFDFKLFDATDVYGTGTPIAEVKGTTAGTRITVD